MIGGPGGAYYGRYESGKGLAVSLPGTDDTDDLDYDGAGSQGMPFRGRIGTIAFESFDQMRSQTTEKHAVQVDMDVFAAAVPFPNPPLPERPIPDLRLKPGSAAVDAGAILANINDNFTGKAPDLGAYELGQDLPLYGPRPAGVDEETMFKAAAKKKGGKR
jgi:hypothetical protein